MFRTHCNASIALRSAFYRWKEEIFKRALKKLQRIPTDLISLLKTSYKCLSHLVNYIVDNFKISISLINYAFREGLFCKHRIFRNMFKLFNCLPRITHEKTSDILVKYILPKTMQETTFLREIFLKLFGSYGKSEKLK